jgi:hypothetical protein
MRLSVSSQLGWSRRPTSAAIRAQGDALSGGRGQKRLCHFPGVIPKRRWNMRVKCVWLLNPQFWACQWLGCEGRVRHHQSLVSGAQVVGPCPLRDAQSALCDRLERPQIALARPHRRATSHAPQEHALYAEGRVAPVIEEPFRYIAHEEGSLFKSHTGARQNFGNVVLSAVSNGRESCYSCS